MPLESTSSIGITWSRFLDEAFEPISLHDFPKQFLAERSSPQRIKPEWCPNIKNLAHTGYFILAPHDLYLSNDDDSVIRFYPTVRIGEGEEGYEFFNPDQVGDYESFPRFFKINSGILFEPVNSSWAIIGPSDPRLVNQSLYIQPALINPGYNRQLAVVVCVLGDKPVLLSRGDVICQIVPINVTCTPALIEKKTLELNTRAPEYSLMIDKSSCPVDLRRASLNEFDNKSTLSLGQAIKSRKAFTSFLSFDEPT